MFLFFGLCKITYLFMNAKNIWLVIGQNMAIVVKKDFLWSKNSIFAPNFKRKSD